MSERRAFSRVECAVDATLQVEDESFPSKIRGLSLNGALIDTAASPRKGDKVTVTLTMALTVRCPGRVVRAERRGLGVAFEDLDQESLAHLRDIVSAHGVAPEAIDKELARALRGDKADQ